MRRLGCMYLVSKTMKAPTDFRT